MLPRYAKPCRQQRGISLLEALITLLLMSIIGIGTAYIAAKAAVAQRHSSSLHLTVSQLREALRAQRGFRNQRLVFDLPDGGWLAVQALRRFVPETGAPRWLTLARRQLAARPGLIVLQVSALAVGLPLNMDGSISGSCDRVMSFIDEMKNYPQQLGIEQGTNLWIALFDERLSTSAVNDFLVNDVDMSRTKRAAVVDKLAAQLILQGALDFLKLCR